MPINETIQSIFGGIDPMKVGPSLAEEINNFVKLCAERPNDLQAFFTQTQNVILEIAAAVVETHQPPITYIDGQPNVPTIVGREHLAKELRRLKRVLV